MSADLDKQIDRAVREMLEVEPRADLRARVMSRLPAAGSQLPASGSLFDLVVSGFRRNRVLFTAAAAAALIVLAIVVARRSDPMPQAPVVAQRADQRLTVEPAPSGTAPVQPRGLSAAVHPSGTNAPRRIANTAGDIVQATDAGERIEPLQSIAPITVAAIEQEPIAPAALAVRPLNTISEIQIAPLTPADRRN